MILACSRKLLSFVAVLGLVCALIASACPTCDAVAHTPASAAERHGAEGPSFGGWQEGAEACACCETNRCSGREDPPEVWFQRAGQGLPVPVGLVVGNLLPPGRPSATPGPEFAGDVYGRAKLHLVHASFRC